MERMTTEDLRRVLRETAGEDGTAVVSEETLDTPFTDLGYDSLAIMEIVAALGKQAGIELPETEIVAANFRTPQALWAVVRNAPSGAQA